MQSVSLGCHMFILDVTAFEIITVMKISRVLISMLRYILHYFMTVDHEEDLGALSIIHVR